VKVADRVYAAFPPRLPEDDEVGFDMTEEADDKWYDLPDGWRPVDALAYDFRRTVAPKVVAAHGWGTDILLVWRAGKWSAWKTGFRKASSQDAFDPEAGTRLSTHVEWFEVSPDGSRCVFRGQETERTSRKGLVFYAWTGRVLIERTEPGELLADWREYLKHKARASWRGLA